jgi:putative membrane protein
MDEASRWIPYCGEAPGPGAWLDRWNMDPVLLGILGLLAFAAWRWPAVTARPPLRAALGVALLLYVSPLCALSSAFFTVRVVHHLLVVLALGPLLAQALRPGTRRQSLPLWCCTALANAAFWAWHAPAAYALALSSDGAYGLMQLALLASATAFWLAVARAVPAAALAAVLATMVSMGLLGALITFAARPLYEPHLASTLAWGVSPLADQQLAGVMMWAPGSLAYLACALWIGQRWLRAQPAA